MICAIHQPQYMPWLGYFDKMARADVFVLLDNVQFKKNEWQNRNRIRTPNGEGWQWLTVPVLHDHGQLISDVRINNAVNWTAQHQKALTLNYAKTPYFDAYWPRLRVIFDHEWQNLAELNIAVVRLIAQLLGIQTRIVLARDLPVSTQKTERLIDICKHVHCDRYLAGAGCHHYMDFTLFESSGIQLDLQDYKHPIYPQQWAKSNEQFVSCLSIVDLLFNAGPRSLEVLLSSSPQ